MIRWLGPLAIAGAFLAFPWLLTEPFYQRIGALVLLYAISASAWNLVGGYAGQISVGHAVFFGAGAYMALLVYNLWGLPPLAGVPLGILVSLGIAVVIGLPSFRLRGHYFAMATIAVAELTRIAVANWPLLGAAIGLSGPVVPRSVLDLSFRSAVPYYYIFLAVLALLLAVTWQVERSRMGYYLRALRESERAAQSLGVPVRRYKLYAYLLSAGFTALAGALYAMMVGFIDPDSGFGILISVEMLIMAALGGAGTLFGPLLGALILVPLRETTNSLFGGSGTGITYMIYGGIILLLARFRPGGLIGIWQAYARRRRARASLEARPRAA
jgi:branched-chain amino acid transport system permease protein